MLILQLVLVSTTWNPNTSYHSHNFRQLCMSVTQVYTVQPQVLGGTVVSIEADLSRGLHSVAIVGLAGKAVEEAKDRVSSAIKHSGYDSPKSQNQKIVISLAPADLKKEGPLFDLPIAISYLLTAGHISSDTTKRIFIGEISLAGELRPVRGVLSIYKLHKKPGLRKELCHWGMLLKRP